MKKILSNQQGFIPALALCLIALTGAGIGTVALVDRGTFDFSLVDPEAPEVAAAVGEQNRLMAHDLTDRYLFGLESAQRESGRMAESLGRMYLLEMDQARADLIQSEARHRQTLESANRGYLLILLALCLALVLAFRRPRRSGWMDCNIPGRIDAPGKRFRLDDGRVLVISGKGYRLTDSSWENPVRMIRNQSGNMEIVLYGILALAAFALLFTIAGSGSFQADNSGEMRELAVNLYQESRVQTDQLIAHVLDQSEAINRQAMQYAEHGRGIGIIPLVVGAFLLFMGGIVAAVLLIRTMQPRNSDFVHVSGPRYREIEEVPVRRNSSNPEGRRIEDMMSEDDRWQLITNNRGNIAVFLCLGLMITGVLFLLFSSWMNDRAPAGSAPAQVQKAGSIQAVALVFLRNPEGGEPIRSLCVYDSAGAVFEIGQDQVGAAMQAIGAGKGVLR